MEKTNPWNRETSDNSDYRSYRFFCWDFSIPGTWPSLWLCVWHKQSKQLSSWPSAHSSALKACGFSFLSQLMVHFNEEGKVGLPVQSTTWAEQLIVAHKCYLGCVVHWALRRAKAILTFVLADEKAWRGLRMLGDKAQRFLFLIHCELAHFHSLKQCAASALRTFQALCSWHLFIY